MNPSKASNTARCPFFGLRVASAAKIEAMVGGTVQYAEPFACPLVYHSWISVRIPLGPLKCDIGRAGLELEV